MDYSQIYSEGPSTSGELSDQVANSPADDVVIGDDPNYGIRALSDVFMENQGSYILRVNQFILLPGDTLTMVRPNNDRPLVDSLHIRFLSIMPLAQPLAAYPQLYNGPRLLIAFIPAPPID